jgi:pimeloyl-ACP methyl ester carboxylesterase
MSHSSRVSLGQKTQTFLSLSPPSTTIWASALDPASETIAEPKSSVRRKYETFLWFNKINEYDINYRVEGPVDGTPVLLVHGFGANVSHFRHQFPALVEQGYRVYAIDLLGFGASEKPADAEYSIELFVELLKDFIMAMHSGKQWVVAGNSIGGLCSLAVAEQLPDIVRGVVLFNCSGGMTGFRYEDVPLYLRPILYFVQKVVLGPRLGGHFFANFKTRENVESVLRAQGVYRDQTNVDEELLDILLTPADDEGAEAVFLKTFAGPPGPTPESILQNLTCPVLALWGGADPWTPVDSGMHPGSEFCHYIDDFELVVLPKVGHCPHDEAPDQVHAHMIPWMKKLDNGDK